ncbi:aldehyde dehydrogenase [Halothiobacillus sp.]|uniref:aldehyde dehydrogenase n=1 Tax=Halothiobacillus sp. TaxID=1891311 RepID=UPI002AD508E3|nr:aldehyde dehydrogenase [Halothiobacillus sp.]
MNTIDWHARAAALVIDGRALINGRRVDAVDGGTFECLSPIDGRRLASVARCKAADVDRAVAAARAAFADRRWAGMSPGDRKRTLIRFADLVMANREELALLETLDMGKPISASMATDVPATANTLRWYGEAIDKVYDEIAPTNDRTLALITREPMGVVAAIVPWNYPLLMASWKIAPALVAGNSVILKPSEKSPLTALRLGDLALEAGIPVGVFNVVPGFGPEAGSPLALHMDVDCIAFTGSTAVGKKIQVMAGESNLKRAWCELGGKSPNIVFADCPDLDRAVAAAAGSIFYNQGESCNAPSRLLVERSIRDEFVEKLKQYSPRHMPGDPLDPNTTMGALVDQGQMDNVLKYIEAGKSQGATLCCGGERVRTETGGFYVSPTIFDGVTNEMIIASEEIFGPVLSIITFDSQEEAIQIANDTSYGLAAAVWTRDISRAHLVSRALRAGTVHVNCYDEDDITVPFGGYKQSGNGRDKSLHALEKYTELKTTWISLT